MKTKTISAAIAAVLAAGYFSVAHAAPELLSREAVRDLISGATGKHYYLGHREWCDIRWKTDGTVEAFHEDAKPDDKPIAKGTWRIKEVKPKKDETPESVAKRNAELQFVYCHQFDNMFGGHELCWNVEQETFDKVEGDDKKLAATQRYKMYREAGAETGEYVITRP